MLLIQELPMESYKGHIAHFLLGIALAQPFVDLSSFTTRLSMMIILTFATFFHGIQLLLHETFRTEFDIDTALMIYAMLLRILPVPVLFATGLGMIACIIIVGLQQYDMNWIIGRH